MEKQKVGVIGVGAFGEFMLKYLIPYFRVGIYDRYRNLAEIEALYRLEVQSLPEVAASDIVLLSVPVKDIESVVDEIVPHLRTGALVMDLCSVKTTPMATLESKLPRTVEYLGLHPLFGPQSGKAGIQGLNITLCPGRSTRTACVRAFLEGPLKLNVRETTAAEHDQEMAYVQGLTHLIGKVFTLMEIPELHQKTRTFQLLDEMVQMIRYDSDDLFNAIQRDNPFVAATKERFFSAVKDLESRLAKGGLSGKKG